jgi:transcriptional regulator with XRE-family HTH domain
MLRLRVKEVAEVKGFTIVKLMHKAEVTRNTIDQLYRNPYRIPTAATLEKIARALKISPLELLEDVPELPAPE